MTKNEVTNALARYGMNPDNILVIMHQMMVGRFATISPIEKLKMLEEAVGFQSYRSNVLEAQERLTRLREKKSLLLKSWSPQRRPTSTGEENTNDSS